MGVPGGGRRRMGGLFDGDIRQRGPLKELRRLAEMSKWIHRFLYSEHI